MSMSLQATPSESIIVGWDFSTGSVKALAFDLEGNTIAEVRLPTDLWTKDGVSELSLMQLEGQARATVRALAEQLRQKNRLQDWVAGGISATHHTAGRLDQHHNQVRRMICWNDQTLGTHHAAGLKRLGGQDRAKELTGGPWAVRYSLSHLVKDEATLSESDWQESYFLPHGPATAGYLTGNFQAISISSAASTGILDLRTNRWCQEMLDCLANPKYRQLTWDRLPQILDMNEPIGPLAEHIALEAKIIQQSRPLVYPTLDDQAAGLVGGGAVDPGHVAIILGNSAVVNSSSSQLPNSGNLDVMKLNWGPYLWMRCYSNGAQFLDSVLGNQPDWNKLEAEARQLEPGSGGVSVLPFVLSEPSIGITAPRFEWLPQKPEHGGSLLRASFEAIAYLIALAVQEHADAGQNISRISVSGGIARNDLMLEILASVLNRPLERLESSEGPALGAAVVALAGYENTQRKKLGIAQPFTVIDAVQTLVKFRQPVVPNPKWVAGYQQELAKFQQRLKA